MDGYHAVIVADYSELSAISTNYCDGSHILTSIRYDAKGCRRIISEGISSCSPDIPNR